MDNQLRQKRLELRIEWEHERKLVRRKIGIQYGCLLRFLEPVIYQLKHYLSASDWLKLWKPHWDEYRIVDKTITISFLIHVLIFVFLAIFPLLAFNLTFIVVFVTIFGLRWLNDVSYWIYVYVIKHRSFSPVRSLFLAGINFLEVILFFAIIDFIAGMCFKQPLNTAWESLYYSIETITILGTDTYTPVNLLGGALFSLETMSGLFFLVVVLALITAYISEKGNKK